MAFCTECGFRLPDDSAFCPNCGAAVPVENRDFDKRGQAGDIGADAHRHKRNARGAGSYPPPGKKEPKLGSGATAAIVISVVILLLAIAGYMLNRAISNSSFTGYWESAAVEVNGTEKSSYFGKDIHGLFGIQINGNGTVELCSAFANGVLKGEWGRDESGIVITGDGEEYHLSKKDGRLYLFSSGLYIIYEKAQGDIDHPSVAHGSLAQGSNNPALPLPSSGSENASGGYVGKETSYVAVTGADTAKNEAGKDVLRIYFTYKNCSNYAIGAADALYLTAMQGGKKLSEDRSSEGSEAGRLFNAVVRPNVTVQCCRCYVYDPGGGKVSFSIRGCFNMDDGGALSESFTPGKLPGAPEPMAIQPVPEPKWTASLPAEGVLDGKYTVSVLSAELTADENGYPAVRIRYRFQNGSDKAVSMESAVFACTYQDGVSLETVHASSPVKTDESFSENVAPGETLEASRVYQLRNTSSQIEAEVESSGTYSAVGQTYSVKG